MYNFDEIIERKNTASVKYEELEKNFGKDNLMPFWVADMDLKAPEFLLDELKKRTDHGIFGYTKRMNEYYEGIQKWLLDRHNLNVGKSDIEYGPGVVFLLNMMIRLFTEENDNIIIQTPVYYPFFNVIKGNNRNIVENPLLEKDGKYYMDYEDLEEKAKNPKCKMIILCNPHNPVGRVWTREELEKLGNICNKYNVLVVSDEIHFDLVYKPYKHVSYASISEEFKEKSITCTAPSKTFNIAGLHSAYCVIKDKEKMEKYRNELGLLDLNRSNVYSVTATNILYEKGEIWLEELLGYLKENRDYVINYTKNNLKGIKATEIEGTYLLWLDCRELNMSQDDLENLFVEKAGLALDSGRWFGDNGEGFMRINIACPRKFLEEAMEKLNKVL